MHEYRLFYLLSKRSILTLFESLLNFDHNFSIFTYYYIIYVRHLSTKITTKQKENITLINTADT